MLRKIIFFLLILAVVIGLATIYINKVLIPVKLKEIIVEKASGALNRKVSIADISFSPLKGFTLQNIAISDKKDTEAPLLVCDSASFTMLPMPILKEKKVIIPSVVIEKPRISIVRQTTNAWNFSDLIDKLKASPEKKQSLVVFVKSITIDNGTLQFSDQSLPSPLSETVENLNARISLSLNKTVNFSVSGELPHQPSAEKISVKGIYDIVAKKLTSDINLKNFSLAKYLPLYYQPKNVTIKNGTISSCDIALAYQDKKLTADTRITTDNVDLIIRADKEFYGNPDIEASFGYTFNKKDRPEYSGYIEVKNARLQGMRYLKDIKNIKGRVSFVPGEVSTKGLSGISNETEFHLSGNLKDFDEPIVDIKASADIQLEKLKEYFPEFFKKWQIAVAGTSASILNYKGPLKNKAEAQISITGKIKRAMLTTDKLEDTVTDISGEVTCEPDRVSWKNINATFKNTAYATEGTLTNFAQPFIKILLLSETLQCAAEVEKSDTGFSVHFARGTYFGSVFGAKGNVSTEDSNSPYLNLSGYIQLLLTDLSDIAPVLKPSLINIRPQGTLVIEGSVAGYAKDWKNWQIIAEAYSPAISLKDYTLRRIEIKYSQQDRQIKQCDLSANLYGGTLNIQSAIKLSDDTFPFLVKGSLERMDIQKIKNDSPLKKKDISGHLSVSAEASGSLTDKNAIVGSGSLFIKDGRLWQMNLLEGLGQLIFIPELGDIIFTEANGDFVIKDGKFSTSNLELQSESVTLLCRGWVDFAGNLNFGIHSQFSTEAIEQSDSLKKTITAVLTQSGDYLKIKLTGTLKKPRYYVVPESVDVMKKARDLILEGLQNILE